MKQRHVSTLLLALSVAGLQACGSDSNSVTPAAGPSASVTPAQAGNSTVEGTTTSASNANLVQLAKACGNTLPLETLSCTTPASADGNEPPCNPQLAQSAWSAAHRGNYAQASSNLPGVKGDLSTLNIDHTDLDSAPIIMDFTEPDPQGNVAVWASTVGFSGLVFKKDAETLETLGQYRPSGVGTISTSGAYNLLDRSQNLIVGAAKNIRVFGDAVAGDHRSGVKVLKDFALPPDALCTNNDEMVGITMLPNGNVAFATKYGNVGILPRYPQAMCNASLQVYKINGERCNTGNGLEEVSNSIAADENNNIYVVTSEAMYQIKAQNNTLQQGWRSTYLGAGKTGAGRLGPGSGSTPTLAGTRGSDDRFVVITDGADLMNVVFMWRDQIPGDWKPIREGADRRIACEVPINFGDPNATQSLSEQSVLVRGNSAMVVNNRVALNPLLTQVPSQLQPFTQLLSGLSFNRPHGLQRVDWDPKTRTCHTVWSNTDISWPNGIPTMSAADGLIYGIGSRTVNGIDTWTLEAVNFASGQTEFVVPSTPLPSDNSFYAATTIGPDHSVWTGTFGGITRFRSCKPGESNCGRKPDYTKAVPLSALNRQNF
ncbi:hypothetical protein [Limnobacter litoralis]|uniref:Lipoprotein n=1 Tax=Limnobacter litoralis TaxID=481366 RepID=A0ABQ5YRF3_9BURK|nr:hypothetical protein [Limnobacter litoralis]GLR27053.1 hypothetical protein GCM10007875_21440 [Limnobacter litoralis]